MSQLVRKSLGNIFKIARGGSPRPIQSFLTDDSDGLNWIKIGDAVEGSKYITTTKQKIRKEGLNKSRLVDVGDFLLTNSMSFGRPYILKISGCIHDGWLVLSPKDSNAHSDFFYYLLGSDFIFREFTKRAAGAVVKNLNIDLVKSVEIPLPPLEEQKRIAGILDAADALRAKRRETLEQLDQLAQSTFLEMFGDPVTNPKGWEVSDMLEVCNKITDGTHHSPPICDEGVPYITAKHLKKDGLKFFDNPWFISADDHTEIFNRCDPSRGDVLYIKDGATTGIAAINYYEFEFSMLSSLALLKPKSKLITSEYLCAFLNNERNKSHLTNNMGGAAIKRFTLAKIKKFQIPLPPLPLQKEFASIIESIEKQKERVKAHLEELDTLFSSLQSRAFKGEL